MLRIELFRLGCDGRERDALPVLAECIDAALDEVIGALSQAGVDLLLQPGMRLMMVVWVVAESG